MEINNLTVSFDVVASGNTSREEEIAQLKVNLEAAQVNIYYMLGMFIVVMVYDSVLNRLKSRH